MRFDGQIFKPNDIRGTYPDQVNEGFAHMLGCSLVEVLGAKRVALGRDCRLSSPALCGALAGGVRSAGAEVGALDLCPVELLYYLMGQTNEFDLAVMVTASHNPAQFNGFKVVAAGGEPIGERNGLKALRRWIASSPAASPGPIATPEKSLFLEEDYLNYAVCAAGLPDARGLVVVVDPGNGTGGLLWRGLSDALGIEPIQMNFEPDGRFPSHDPNPALLENVIPLRDRVVQEGADIGFAYDGDADRTVAVLGDGHIMDGSETMVALLEQLLQSHRSDRCAVSMVTGRKALDFIRARGVEPLIVPVGHAKVKALMKSDPGIGFAGEQSGHYFYREFYCCESSLITTLRLLHLCAAGRLESLVEGLPGPWLAPAKEPAFRFDHREDALSACRTAARAGIQMFPAPLEVMCECDWQVRRRCALADIEQAEAIRVDYRDWWFCVRPSGTEPLARLSVEARSEQELETKLAALCELFHPAPAS